MKLTTPGYRQERAEKPYLLGVNFNLEQFFPASIGNRDEFNSTYKIWIVEYENHGKTKRHKIEEAFKQKNE